MRDMKPPRKRRTKKEMEDQRRKDARIGEITKNRYKESFQDTTKVRVEGEKIRDIKERLGIGDVQNKNEKDEPGGSRVSKLTRMFEKDVPPKIETVL